MSDHASTASSSRRQMTWACYGLLFVFGLSVGMPGPAAPSMQAAYGLSYAGAALHLTLFSAGSAVGSLVDDRLGRRFARATVLRGALVGVMAGTTVTGLAPNAAGSLAGITVVGFCATIAMNIAHGVIGSEYGDARDTILVNAHLAAAVGLVSAAVALAAARAVGQWRLAFAVPIVVVVMALMRGLPMVLPPRAPNRIAMARTTSALPVAIRIGGAVLALAVAVEWAVTFWAASYLREPVGLPSGYADAVTVLVLATLVAGRWGLRRLTRGNGAAGLLRAALVATVAVSVPYLAGTRLPEPFDVGVPILALVMLCLLVTALFPLTLNVTLAVTGPSAAEQQRASATALSIGAIGAIVTPYLLGAIADASTLTVALIALPVGSALALVGLTAMRGTAAP